MTPLPELSSPTIAVWGEPTVCDIAVCASAFARDGSVSGEIQRWYGGSAYATAYGAAQLGASVVFHGPFGSDADGALAAEAARAVGVTVVPVAGHRSRRTVIVVDTDASRSMVSDVGDAFLYSYADDVSALVGGVVHVSLSSLARDTTGAVMRLIARSTPAVLSIDAGSVGVLEHLGREALQTLINAARHVVMFANPDEAAALRSLLGVDITQLGCLVERLRDAGAVAHISGDQVAIAPLPGVQVVDTTGAGDAFAAGFLAAWAAGTNDVAVALQAAHRHAAAVVSQVGTVWSGN